MNALATACKQHDEQVGMGGWGGALSFHVISRSWGKCWVNPSKKTLNS